MREPQDRHDIQIPGATPNVVRDVKERHTIATKRPHIDGYGTPFHVEFAEPGWRASWLSEVDIERFSDRNHEPVAWGDHRIKAVGVSGSKAKEGSAIKYKELTLYLEREEDALARIKEDPMQASHAALMREVEGSGNIEMFEGNPFVDHTKLRQRGGAGGLFMRQVSR